MAPRKKAQETIEKKEKPDSSTSRLRLGEIGTPYLSTTGDEIQKLKKTAFSTLDRTIRTCDEMASDATVRTAIGLVKLFLIESFYEFDVVPGKKKTQRAKDFADFCKWNLKNQQEMSWIETISNISSFIQYGFSALQKSYTKNTSGRYQQYPYRLSRLAPIPQHSITRFDVTDNTKFITQAPPLATPLSSVDILNLAKNTDFPRSKVMMFSWDSTNLNPAGDSPLSACFKAWKEKNWIEDYQVVGISHDMTGVLAIRVPTEMLSRAAADPSGSDALSLDKLQKDAANVQRGEQTYLILSSDTNDAGKYEYDAQLMSTSGGKQFNLTEIIDQRIKAILNCFGAGVIVMGQDGSGSYALSQTGESIHAHYQSMYQIFVRSVFENDLFPQLAELNGISLEEDEMPRFVPRPIDQIDLGTASSALQKMGAVNLIPRTKDFLIPLYDLMGLPVDSLLEMTEAEFDEALRPIDAMQSRSGDGMKSGLNNSTSNVVTADAAVANASGSTV